MFMAELRVISGRYLAVISTQLQPLLMTDILNLAVGLSSEGFGLLRVV